VSDLSLGSVAIREHDLQEMVEDKGRSCSVGGLVATLEGLRMHCLMLKHLDLLSKKSVAVQETGSFDLSRAVFVPYRLEVDGDGFGGRVESSQLRD
jgi:hypothetical protein